MAHRWLDDIFTQDIFCIGNIRCRDHIFRVHFVEHVEVLNDRRELSAEDLCFLFRDPESYQAGDMFDGFGINGLSHRVSWCHCEGDALSPEAISSYMEIASSGCRPPRNDTI